MRADNGRFLRAADVEDDGSQDQFYWWDGERGLTPAPRAELELGDADPALEGTFTVELKSGNRAATRRRSR